MKSFREMVTVLAKPGADILAELTPKKCALLHMSACIMEEVGELLDSCSIENTVEEFGDIHFYFEGLLQELGIKELPEGEAEDLSIAAAKLYGSIKPHLFYNKQLEFDKVLLSCINFQSSLLAAHEKNYVCVEVALEHNKHKLSKRYDKLQYSNEQAVSRADKDLLAYEKELMAHDWYYEMSDDQSVWRKGRDNQDRLLKMSRLSKAHKELYIKYGEK